MNRFLYLGMPISLLVLPYVFYSAFDGADFYFGKESGAVENITAVLLAVAIFLVARTMWRVNVASSVAFRTSTAAWLVIFGLGCVYFLGEEISWGQHLFGWATPDSWMAINDQGETNLHNTSGWLDQIPRTVLTIGIIVGGLFFPMTRTSKRPDLGRKVETFFVQFMPSQNCIVAAACVLGISLLGGVHKSTDLAWLGISTGEVKESLIAMFILVYIVDFSQRLLQPEENIQGEHQPSISPMSERPMPERRKAA